MHHKDPIEKALLIIAVAELNKCLSNGISEMNKPIQVKSKFKRIEELAKDIQASLNVKSEAQKQLPEELEKYFNSLVKAITNTFPKSKLCCCHRSNSMNNAANDFRRLF